MFWDKLSKPDLSATDRLLVIYGVTVATDYLLEIGVRYPQVAYDDVRQLYASRLIRGEAVLSMADVEQAYRDEDARLVEAAIRELGIR